MLNTGHVKLNLCHFHLLVGREWPPNQCGSHVKKQGMTLCPQRWGLLNKQQNLLFIPMTHPRYKIKSCTLLFYYPGSLPSQRFTQRSTDQPTGSTSFPAQLSRRPSKCHWSGCYSSHAISLNTAQRYKGSRSLANENFMICWEPSPRPVLRNRSCIWW